MTCEEIKISLHDYVDEQLDLITKNEIKSHLYGCDLCFKEYQKIRNFFEQLKRLPYTLEPHEDIIDDFSKMLLDKSRPHEANDFIISATDKKRIEKEQKKQEAKLKAGWSVNKKSRASKTIGGTIYSRKYLASTVNWRKILLFPIIFIILGAAYFVYDFQKRNSPWNFEVLSGSVYVNGKPPQTNNVSEKEILSTGENSQLILFVPQTAKIQLMPESGMVVEKAKNGSNKVKINSGSARVISTVDIPDLIVDFAFSNIIDKSGTFTLNIDKENNALLTVETGFVEIKFAETSTYVKDGYVCKILNGRNPGIPYRINASDNFKNVVNLFSGSEDTDSVFQKIVSSAGKDDMLSLLAMIPNVSQLQRQILFQTIANHFPPPYEVTRLGILKADKDMLYEWWEEMEWQL